MLVDIVTSSATNFSKNADFTVVVINFLLLKYVDGRRHAQATLQYLQQLA